MSPTQQIIEELYYKWNEVREKRKKNDTKINICSSKSVYGKTLSELNALPFKPDQKISVDIINASSISFLLVCRDVSILLLADSRPEIIVGSLTSCGFTHEKPLVVDYVKISHHGSLNNTSQDLLSLIRSNKYIISTNGGTADHMLPSRETIARIVHNTNRSDDMLMIYFNYSIPSLKERLGDFINDNDLELGNWDAQHKTRF